ncbi:MAG TPA: copper resistance protein CopC [Candidatus Limnocylindria bacterium]|nr:copper resistance protein CopC [Candidatus Limnocylindria bacterium]
MRFATRRAGSHRLAALVPLLAAAAVLATAASPAAVSAHARLRSSEPAAGAALGSPPTAVTLTFSETPDLRLTSIKVLDSGGRDVVTGPVVAAGDPALSVTVPLGELDDGVYTVSWRTVSAVDSHISAGSLVFGVGQAPPSAAPGAPTDGASESGTPPAIGARWILYLGLVVLLGAALVALAVVRGRNPDLLAMAAAGWALTALGTIGVVGVQWAETGAPIEALPSTSIGIAALARAISLAIVGMALVALAAVPTLGGRGGWAAVGVAAAGALVVDVATGHAAAGPAWIQQIAVQSLHGLGAAVWVGGLAGLLVALRSTPAGERLDTARRFSSWAGVALVVVALTGVARAVAEVATLDALVTTDFGRVVLAKSGLLLALAALGAANRFFTLRNAARLATGLRRIGAAELVLAVAVLGLSALLVNLSPPAAAGGPVGPADRPIIASGHDFGTSVRARLVATPGGAGVNTFDLALRDYDSGEPVDASAVELRFEVASLTGVEPSTLALQRSTMGRFTGSGPNLPIDGIWRITATVTVAGGALDVPLVAATTITDQPTEQLVTPGLPTVYSVQLGAAGSAQVYLDPGGPGPNELHVTYFDPAGGELDVAEPTIAVVPADGEGVLLPARFFDVGHYVASIEAVAGPLDVDIVGALPGGAGPSQIHLHVTIEVAP